MKNIYIICLALTIFNISIVNAKVASIQETICMAKTIYWEARGEPYDGKLGVAGVVLNRVAHEDFPNTICEVVRQKKPIQFSKEIIKRTTIKDKKAWQESLDLAGRIVNRHIRIKPTFKAIYFDNAKVIAPKGLVLHMSIGKHKFYNKR